VSALGIAAKLRDAMGILTIVFQQYAKVIRTGIEHPAWCDASLGWIGRRYITECFASFEAVNNRSAAAVVVIVAMRSPSDVTNDIFPRWYRRPVIRIHSGDIPRLQYRPQPFLPLQRAVD
jgi:hypothetical protein